jgi:hypothetical protein
MIGKMARPRGPDFKIVCRALNRIDGLPDCVHEFVCWELRMLLISKPANGHDCKKGIACAVNN